MKLLFKQRLFSWFDSYDIYDEEGNTVYTVQGKMSWGHCLHILDASGLHIATVKERVLSFLPRFEMYKGEKYLGCVKKELSFLKPRYEIDFMGWSVEGSFLEWDYCIQDRSGRIAGTVSKEVFHLTDTYVLEAENPQNALYVLMLALAIDAEKCSRN